MPRRFSHYYTCVLCIILFASTHADNASVAIESTQAIQNIPAVPKQPPAQPAPAPQEKKALETPQRNPDAIGPDTFGKNPSEIGMQGNWLKKRTWLLKAFDLTTQIKPFLEQIQQTRQAFMEKYPAIDQELDEFYSQFGVDQGKLEEVFSSIARYLEKKHTQEQKNLTDVPRSYFVSLEASREALSQQQKILKQLMLDAESIGALDQSLEARLKKVDETIANTQAQANHVDEVIDQLWYIIDDKKAADLYFSLNRILEQFKSTQTYLQDNLLADFDRVIGTIRQQVATATASIQNLENNGIIVRDRAKKIEAIKMEALRKEREEAERTTFTQTALTSEEQEETPWYKKIVLSFYDTFVSIGALISNIFSKPQTPKNIQAPVSEKVTVQDDTQKTEAQT